MVSDAPMFISPIRLTFPALRARTALNAKHAKNALVGLVALAAITSPLAPAQARVTRLVIDERVPLAGAAPGPAYEQIAGRAFGALDPALPGNALIQDIGLQAAA